MNKRRSPELHGGMKSALKNMPYTMNGQHPVAWGSVDHPGYSSNARQKESGSLVDEGTLAPMLSSTSMRAIAGKPDRINIITIIALNPVQKLSEYTGTSFRPNAMSNYM